MRHGAREQSASLFSLLQRIEREGGVEPVRLNVLYPGVAPAPACRNNSITRCASGDR